MNIHKLQYRKFILISTLIALTIVLYACASIYYSFQQRISALRILTDTGATFDHWRTALPLGITLNKPLSSETGIAIPELICFPVSPKNPSEVARALDELTGIRDILIFAEEPPVSHELLIALQRQTSLASLDLTGARLDDRGWTLVGQLRQLKNLYINSNKMTDENFAALGSLSNLELLSIGDQPITSRSVPTLLRFTKLRTLTIDLTEIDLSQKLTLEKSLPKAKITIIPR